MVSASDNPQESGRLARRGLGNSGYPRYHCNYLLYDRNLTLDVERPILNMPILNILMNQGNFLIDTTLGRDTIFGVFVEDDENHHIKAVTFRDTEG